MKYCQQCGAPMDDQAVFCSRCGAANNNGYNPGSGNRGGYQQAGYNGGYQQAGYDNGYPRPGYGGGYQQPGYDGGYQQAAYGENPGDVLYTLTKKMRSSATIWTIVGVLQLVVAIPCLIFGYGLAVVIMGIWNVVQASKERKNAAFFEQHPAGIINHFEAQGTMLIVFLVLNLILGAFIGVIGSIYDLTVRSYALSHRDELLRLGRSAQGGNAGNQYYG